MEGTVDVGEFMDAPVGRYLAGRTFAYWCARPELFGFMLWGRPGGDDMRLLSRALRVELAPGIVPHRSLVDTRRIESVDADAFVTLNEYVRTNHAGLRERVTRLALVRPEGMAGAVVAGFYQVLDPPYPVCVFDEPMAALAWLEGAADGALLGELDRIHDELTGTEPIVGALRTLLAERLAEIDVHAAARVLGVSERTLQRRLQDAGTTFQQELCAARIKDAQRRMLDTDAPLTSIALDVGFGSLQHFSALYRRITGLSPSEWRAAHRRDSGGGPA